MQILLEVIETIEQGLTFLQFSEIAFLKACNEVRLVVYLVFCVAILKVVVGWPISRISKFFVNSKSLHSQRESVNVELEKKILKIFTTKMIGSITHARLLSNIWIIVDFFPLYANDLEGWCFNLDSSQFTTCNTVKLCFMQIEQFITLIGENWKNVGVGFWQAEPKKSHPKRGLKNICQEGC